MRSYNAIYQGNILTGTIHENPCGGYLLVVYLQYQGRSNQIVSYGDYRTVEQAEAAMCGVFPGTYWRQMA